jgi:hypothetical protein
MEKEPIQPPTTSPTDRGTFSGGQTVMTDVEVVWRRIRKDRFLAALDYIALYIYIIVVYGGALLTDYFLFTLMWWMVREDADKYPLVSIGLDYAKIGLALLFITGAVIHGVISTYSQLKFDFKLSKED